MTQDYPDSLRRGMAPAFCNRCGDAVEEGCDPKDELAELDALLERLRIKRCLLKRKINRFHSPIVRHLPPDVMSTIFEFCLPDLTNHHDFRYTEEDLSIPLSLGAICSYWRDIAWSTPSLWSSFTVRGWSSRRKNIAQEWLARSGQLPLSIHIYSRCAYETFLALFDIINQYSTRWSDLDLCMPYYYYSHLNPTDNHAPILKFIRLSSSIVSTRTNLNFQLTCPRLERAELSFFPMDGTNIQWDNLTHLTLDSMSFADSFLILRKTPRLVFCKVSGACSLGRNPIPSIEALVLTSLKTLQLLTVKFDEDFLINLTAPHLEELSLPNYYYASMGVVTSFLRRSACSLRSLSTIVKILPPCFDDFMSLLQSIPSLNTLSISIMFSDLQNAYPEDYNPRNILQLVVKILSSQSTSRQQGFLPNLKILEYIGDLYLRPGNYDDLNSLPPADNAVHGPFHLLKLDITEGRIPKDMISYLSNLAERGVTVNVLYDSEDVLQSSIDYYSRKDSLCQDWIDNMDSSLFS